MVNAVNRTSYLTTTFSANTYLCNFHVSLIYISTYNFEC
jgi:hypothetical protein